MNQRGSTLLYVLVLLLVLTGGLGYYILNNQSQFNLTFSTNNTQNIVVPKETSITSKSPTPSLDISDWKTYTNQLDFENKYPQTWDYYKLGDNDIAFGPTELVKANSIQLNNPNVGALIGGKAWPIEVKPLNGNLYYYGPNQIPFTSNETEKVSSQQLIIDGINAVTYTIVFSEDAPYINKGDIIEVIVITKGNQTYSLTLSDQKYKDIFDQLISTFTFTNQNQTITPTCMTRPACLDATPRCLIAEPASGWCP